MAQSISSAAATPRLNLRTPEVMARVQTQVESHYRSSLVEEIRLAGGSLCTETLAIHLAKEFGFCYGVERAIDLAYAARNVFPKRRIFILGEIIHNPEVIHQIEMLGIHNLFGLGREPDLSVLQEDDIVIVPAFGAEIAVVNKIRQLRCKIVDTTCGDVMSVWKRVRQNAFESVTSIIHGKALHEETRATASRALGNGTGHYLVVLNTQDTDLVCDYIRNGGDPDTFLRHFPAQAYSPGFHPDLHLKKIGVANQTTMLRGETEEVQRRLRTAISDRDHGSEENFRCFDTICGATQERQDALFTLLRSHRLNFLLVIGGYNSSNTTHLAEIGGAEVPTYFIRNSQCLESENLIRHFDVILKREIETRGWLPNFSFLNVGITAGASCPNNLIEETIRRLLELRQ
ncbi:MAG: 4-hydroxy-3-methylbut-2-enyl diphosphate reductase [Verrucomicrobia bacterium]|nr:MAG: 4-hydroxy-3-methylbut-2-enyl diphosphate reductase [Verrucomicrobiota bacterium]